MSIQHNWASPTRLLAIAITGCLLAIFAGCGSGGGDAATPTSPPPPPANVVLNGVTFNPATSAKLDTGFVLTDFASFSTKIFRVGDQYVDKTSLPDEELTWEDVSWATDTLVGIPTAKRTSPEYARQTSGATRLINTRQTWLARAVDGSTYVLKYSIGTSAADFTAPGSTPLLVAGASPAVGDPVVDFVFAVNRAGVVDAAGASSPGGYTGCLRLKFVHPGGNIGYQYIKPGVGIVEWTNHWIGAGRVTPVGTYNLVRPILGGAG